jgi:hypothetical protein
MDGAIAKGVKTRPSFHDILPEVLPGNNFDYMDGATVKGVKRRPRSSGNNISWYNGRVFTPFTVAPSL